MRLRVDIHVGSYEYFLPLLLVPHFFTSLRRHSHRLFPPSVPPFCPLLLLISTTTDNLICSQNRRAAVLIGIRTLCPLSLFILVFSLPLSFSVPLLFWLPTVASRRAAHRATWLNSTRLYSTGTQQSRLNLCTEHHVALCRSARSVSVSLSLSS